MKICPFCKKEIEAWQILCKGCWEISANAIEQSRSEAASLIIRLKGTAKLDLFYLLKEICLPCMKKIDHCCDTCIFKAKEEFIRAFLE